MKILSAAQIIYRDVQHVPKEILIPLERRVFLLHLLLEWSPESPRPHPAVELLEHLFVLRRGQPGACETTDQGDQEKPRPPETSRFRNGHGQSPVSLRYGQSASEGSAPRRCLPPCPEIAIAIETPPIPLQHIRCRIPPHNAVTIQITTLFTLVTYLPSRTPSSTTTKNFSVSAARRFSDLRWD